MKQPFFITIIVVAGVLAMLQTNAQKPKTQKPGSATKVPPLTLAEIFLGHSTLKSGNISKAVFDSVGKGGISTTMPGAMIESFSFMYGERNLYEDSVGNPLPVTDYLTETCFGDSLTSSIKNNIFDRTKAGDTVYYDYIKVRMADGRMTRGRPLKFVLTK